jgi:hypothetical protein
MDVTEEFPFLVTKLSPPMTVNSTKEVIDEYARVHR